MSASHVNTKQAFTQKYHGKIVREETVKAKQFYALQREILTESRAHFHIPF